MPYCIFHSGEGSLGGLCYSVGKGHLAIPEPPALSHLSWMTAQLTIPPFWCPVSIEELLELGYLTWLTPETPMHFSHFSAVSLRVPPSVAGYDLWSWNKSWLIELQQGSLWHHRSPSSYLRCNEWVLGVKAPPSWLAGWWLTNLEPCL